MYERSASALAAPAGLGFTRIATPLRRGSGPTSLSLSPLGLRQKTGATVLHRRPRPPSPVEKAPTGRRGEAFSVPRQLVSEASRNPNRRITLPRQCRGGPAAALLNQTEVGDAVTRRGTEAPCKRKRRSVPMTPTHGSADPSDRSPQQKTGGRHEGNEDRTSASPFYSAAG